MVATAKRLNRCFALDFNHRFTDAARVAKKWEDEGRWATFCSATMALWIGSPRTIPPPTTT
jgi:predicted dehydrogenase